MRFASMLRLRELEGTYPGLHIVDLESGLGPHFYSKWWK